MSRASVSSVRAGEVIAFPATHGGWGACQVLQADDRVEVLALDHLSDARPTLATVSQNALSCSAFEVTVTAHRMRVLDELPADFVSLGVIAPLQEPAANPLFAGPWDALREAAQRERRWSALPETVREPFVRLGSATPVTVALGPTRLTTHHRHPSLHLVFDGRPREPSGLDAGDSSRFDWTALDALPCLRRLHVTGDAPGMLRWLETRRALDALTWEAFADESVDLRATHLTACRLDGASLRALHLSPTLSSLDLTLRRDHPTAVHAARDGAGLALVARAWDDDDLASLHGLADLSQLTVEGLSSLSLASVARFSRVRALTLNGAPGRLRDGAALGALTALQVLHLRGCVEVDVATMPRLDAWPALRALHAWRLHQRDAAALKARWGRDARVHLTESLNDAGLFAEADLPIARWPETTRKGIVRAGFAAAAKVICRAGLTDEVAQRALAGFAKAVARAERETGALDPAEREAVEACRARLAERANATRG
jgi:hypothetical protein